MKDQWDNGALRRAFQVDNEESVDPVRLAALQQMLRSRLNPVRPILQPAIFAMAFAAAAGLLTLMGILLLPSLGWSGMTLNAKLAVFATLIASAGLLAYSLSLQMAPGRRTHWPPGMLVVGILVLTSIVMASVFQVRAHPNFVDAGMVCVRAGASFALAAAIAFALLLWRGYLISPAKASMLAGLLSGLVGMAVLEIHCPNFDLWHRLVWHLGIPFAGAAAGWVFGMIGQAIGRRQFALPQDQSG